MVCNSCPRKCNTVRGNGYCKSSNIHIAKIIYDFKYEEPCFSGRVVAIFFAGCNLKCSFCQNYLISNDECGEEYSISDFVNLLKDIDKNEYDYIDLVTPTQYEIYIIDALKVYRPKAKIIFNTSGYENSNMIEELNRYVDVYLTDAKYFSQELSKKYSNAEDYFKVFTKAILKMREIKDKFIGPKILSGLIVRILILPGYIEDSINILNFIKTNLGDETIISLMNQFTPNGRCDIDRTLSPLEYKIVYKKLIELGFKNGYSQSLESANSIFTPDFKCC